MPTANRKTWLVALALALLVAVLLWRIRGHDETTPSATPGAAHGSAPHAAPTTPTHARLDPTSLVRGSIAGTITDEATHAAIPHARVCVDGKSLDIADELLREPTCVVADQAGHYLIDKLLPAEYRAGASAKPYRPGIHHPGGNRKKTELHLAAGEHKVGIDIALRPGGVEVTGVVADVTGGPIAHAHVYVREGDWTARTSTVFVETDEQGAFTLWVSPGDTQVEASAEGYAESSESVHAPGKVELLLTPESSVAGTVIDAETGVPVEGARVLVGASEWGWDSGETTFSDGKGAFRVSRLPPGRIVAVARTDHGYGRTEGTTLVGLGQHVEGVIVKLFPAHHVEGMVVIAATKAVCDEPSVGLRDATTNRWITMQQRSDHTLVADGLLAGTYTPEVQCAGFQAHDKYDPITIGAKDALGLVWEVDRGATIRGKVTLRTGEPVEDANLWARTVGGAARDRSGWGGDSSARDGSYELTGLRAGSYKIELQSDKGIAPKDGYKVDVRPGATVDKDLVLDGGGVIKGVLVDPQGNPVAGIGIRARPITSGTGWSWGDGGKSDETGAFTIDSLRPGDYRVSAQKGWSDALRKPGTTDDAKQGEKVTVRAGQAATVRLVVEAQSGQIKGTVVDTDGKPVADAFVSAARESDAAGAQKSNVEETRWTWEDKPVITTVEGTFTVGKLSPGTYTVRAYRKGGGEAIAEHVAVGTTTRLQIKATGSIEGTATRDGGPPEELTIEVQDLASGFWRSEKYFMTKGHFVLRDLPKGHFSITAEGGGSHSTITVDLAEGETKTNVAITLEPLLTLTGRIVELGTQKPVAGIRMFAAEAAGGGFSFGGSDEDDNISDESGTFTIKNAPRGKLMIRGFPKDWGDSEYQATTVIRTVTGSGTVAVGDVPILRKRVKPGDAVGELGVNFAEQARDIPPDKRELKVSWIDPAGPAAKTELVVGDVVTSIDSIDITGANAASAYAVLRAPPGTRLSLGLARGVTVTVVLASP